MITLNERLNDNTKKVPFKSNINSFTGIEKAADLFLKSQENLSSTRFIQDTATNWMPKAIFARSKADFAEMSFLEFLESGIFYFAAPLFGEKIFRNKLFKLFQPKALQNKINEQIPKTIEQIRKNENLSNEIKRRSIAVKAGIVLACTIVPVAEYTLSFAKNLFTLKTFKKSNFNNIANLDKNSNEKEDKEQQKKVERNSKYQLKKAGVISATGILLGAIIAITGHKSDKLQTLAKSILEPGKALSDVLNKTGLKSEKIKNTLSKFSLDFENNNGKLALSKGQLALTAILGLFGYSKAAEDRGKLDVAEVWTRVPLVVFYTIFGSELFEKGFTKLLAKKNIFPDIIQKTKDGAVNIPKRSELPLIAEKLSKVKNSDTISELNRLTKQKAFVSAVPYAFSLIFMGLTLSGITRLFTQYRYNKQLKNNTLDKNINAFYYPVKSPEIFDSIKMK